MVGRQKLADIEMRHAGSAPGEQAHERKAPGVRCVPAMIGGMAFILPAIYSNRVFHA
jgi:hypothetical protein